jgi:uncharacterized protein (DUF924 family)
MSDRDIRRVLDFWFAWEALDSPRVDSRMDRWFGEDKQFDDLIRGQFEDLIRRASDGKLSDWKMTPEGRLALIILIDQFRRNVYRGKGDAFTKDAMALQLCLEGIEENCHKNLKPVQNLFFFMPMQHAESLDIQKQSVETFRALAESVTDTMRETFLTTAHFAELHHDIVAEFGRFPHRNRILGRLDTVAETEYLTGKHKSFGQ